MHEMLEIIVVAIVTIVMTIHTTHGTTKARARVRVRTRVENQKRKLRERSQNLEVGKREIRVIVLINLLCQEMFLQNLLVFETRHLLLSQSM
jgi:hypothetical protein